MIRSSTKPKGATSYKETKFGIIPRSKLLLLELEGTKKGLEFIAKVSKQKISPDLILSIHKEAFGWIFPDWAGKYRTVRVEFSGKEAVLPNQVPELIVNLCADLNERLEHLKSQDENFINLVVELLAWFQHRFVWIHPFQDYNGRVARMLTILILLKLNLPPVEIKAERGFDRKKYLESMYAADEGNYEKLENLIASALDESLVKITQKR
jgi:Fic family protein